MEGWGRRTDEADIRDGISRLQSHEAKNVMVKTSGIPWLPFHIEQKSN